MANLELTRYCYCHDTNTEVTSVLSSDSGYFYANESNNSKINIFNA